MSDPIAWMVAMLALGLYWGERGRRIDAQQREGVIQVRKPKRAKVIPPGGATAPALAHDMDGARERYVDEAMREGHTRAAAEADWEALIESSQISQDGAWS